MHAATNKAIGNIHKGSNLLGAISEALLSGYCTSQKQSNHISCLCKKKTRSLMEDQVSVLMESIVNVNLNRDI